MELFRLIVKLIASSKVGPYSICFLANITAVFNIEILINAKLRSNKICYLSIHWWYFDVIPQEFMIQISYGHD